MLEMALPKASKASEGLDGQTTNPDMDIFICTLSLPDGVASGFQEGKTKHWVAVVFNKICKDKGAICTTLVSHNIRSQFFNQVYHGCAHL
jgi:hypothetical protein